MQTLFQKFAKSNHGNIKLCVYTVNHVILGVTFCSCISRIFSTRKYGTAFQIRLMLNLFMSLCLDIFGKLQTLFQIKQVGKHIAKK